MMKDTSATIFHDLVKLSSYDNIFLKEKARYEVKHMIADVIWNSVRDQRSGVAPDDVFIMLTNYTAYNYFVESPLIIKYIQKVLAYGAYVDNDLTMSYVQARMLNHEFDRIIVDLSHHYRLNGYSIFLVKIIHCVLYSGNPACYEVFLSLIGFTYQQIVMILKGMKKFGIMEMLADAQNKFVNIKENLLTTYQHESYEQELRQIVMNDYNNPTSNAPMFAQQIGYVVRIPNGDDAIDIERSRRALATHTDQDLTPVYYTLDQMKLPLTFNQSEFDSHSSTADKIGSEIPDDDYATDERDNNDEDDDNTSYDDYSEDEQLPISERKTGLLPGLIERIPIVKMNTPEDVLMKANLVAKRQMVPPLRIVDPSPIDPISVVTHDPPTIDELVRDYHTLETHVDDVEMDLHHITEPLSAEVPIDSDLSLKIEDVNPASTTMIVAPISEPCIPIIQNVVPVSQDMDTEQDQFRKEREQELIQSVNDSTTSAIVTCAMPPFIKHYVRNRMEKLILIQTKIIPKLVKNGHSSLRTPYRFMVRTLVNLEKCYLTDVLGPMTIECNLPHLPLNMSLCQKIVEIEQKDLYILDLDNGIGTLFASHRYGELVILTIFGGEIYDTHIDFDDLNTLLANEQYKSCLRIQSKKKNNPSLLTNGARSLTNLTIKIFDYHEDSVITSSLLLSESLSQFPNHTHTIDRRSREKMSPNGELLFEKRAVRVAKDLTDVLTKLTSYMETLKSITVTSGKYSEITYGRYDELSILQFSHHNVVYLNAFIILDEGNAIILEHNFFGDVEMNRTDLVNAVLTVMEDNTLNSIDLSEWEMNWLSIIDTTLALPRVYVSGTSIYTHFSENQKCHARHEMHILSDIDLVYLPCGELVCKGANMITQHSCLTKYKVPFSDLAIDMKLYALLYQEGLICKCGRVLDHRLRRFDCDQCDLSNV